jgi:hypothetical protein
MLFGCNLTPSVQKHVGDTAAVKADVIFAEDIPGRFHYLKL